MNRSKWCVRVVLPKCQDRLFEHFFDNKRDVYFDAENLNFNEGFQSDILTGRMVYIDDNGQQVRSKPLLLKVFPQSFQKSSFTELTFQNETFVYNRIIPFFATFTNSIYDLFPEFYYAQLDFSSEEDGVIVMENLIEKEYRSSASKIFLDIEHLLLMVKKLGQFHAYSYQAKKVNPEKFFSLVNCLTETHYSVTKTLPNFNHPINQHLLEILSSDERYKKKVDEIRRLVGNTDEFIVKVLDTRKEPVAVLCHGDFLRNNALFKYDAENNPVDVKFIDLGNMRYCTPVVDLGLILYMNADQQTRDEYWDLLIQTYYEALKNTFPHNDLVPSKEDILSEFKHNIFQPYFLLALFIPWMMAMVESNTPDWFKNLFVPEYVQYQDLPMTELPEDIRVSLILHKMFRPHRVKKVLEALCDIIDRGFV